MNLKKKIFPKIKNKLKNFLTDESWKITKKNAITIWALTAISSWVDLIQAHNGGRRGRAHHRNINVWHWSATPWGGHRSAYWSWHLSFAWVGHCNSSAPVYWHYSWNLTWGHVSSAVISGHKSANAWHGSWNAHSSHGSHWSHGSHGSHWSHWSSWDSWN